MNILVLLLSFPILISAQGSISLKEKLLSEINNLTESVNGDFAVASVNLKTGEEIYINEKENFHAASTMKTPVMIEVFLQAETGKFDMSDSIHVKNEFRSIVDSSLYTMDIADDSGEDLYKYLDKNRTIYELTYSMITVSSNLATNILIDLVGAENVMKTMKKIGADDIQVLRGVEDIKAYRKGKNNTATAYDLAVIFKAISDCSVTNQNSCNEMMNILLDQKFDDIIPAKLPGNVKVAHKTGSITGVRHDSGIVLLPGGESYVLVLLSKNLEDGDAGIEVSQDISKLVYDYYTSD
jgi:beta-lactamase class A